MTIYVGNIPYAIRENEIAELFSKYGKIISIKIQAVQKDTVLLKWKPKNRRNWQ
jgi:RNA recognition motif-containing protein